MSGKKPVFFKKIIVVINRRGVEKKFLKASLKIVYGKNVLFYQKYTVLHLTDVNYFVFFA